MTSPSPGDPTAPPPASLGGLEAGTAQAAAALGSLKAPAEAAAQSIDEAFAKAGASLATSLARAAADGKITLQDLARAVIAAVDAAAGQRPGGGLASAIGLAVGTLFSGARAAGGPVSPGGQYLVGEGGPEVFRPSAPGAIEPASAQGVTVNVTVQGEGQASLLRSEAQIAQALARAAALGARRL